MVRMMKTEQEEAVPEGVYIARLTGVEEQDGKYGAYLRWSFQIEDDDDDDVDGRTVSGQTPAKLTEGGRTDKWIKNLGVDLDIGDEVDLDDLIGKKAQITIKINKKGDKEFSNVQDVLPRKKKKPKKTDDDDEDEKSKKEKKPKKTDDDDEDEKSKKEKKPKKTDDDDDFNFDD